MSGNTVLPQGWMQVTLGDVGEIISGGTPSTAIPEYWNGEINWITPADLSGYSKKYIIHGAKSISKLGLKKSSAKLMPKGSVLFSSRAPIGYVVIANSELCTNQGFKSIIPNESVFNEYLFYFLKSAKKEVQDAASGTTFKEISLTKFSKLRIPLPPLAEQQRIVAKIEELFSSLDKGIESLKSAQQQLKVYRQSVLKAAFSGKLTEKFRKISDNEKGTCLPAGRLEDKLTKNTLRQAQGGITQVAQGAVMPVAEPVEATNKDSELPEGWRRGLVKDISLSIQYGYTGSSSKENIGPKFLRITDIQDNNVNWDDVPYCQIDEQSKQKYILDDGDLVFARTGATVGKSFLIKGKIPESIFASYLIRLKFPKHVNDKYVWYYFQSPFYWSQIYDKQVGIGQPNVNGTKLGKLEIVIPRTVEEQNAIVAAIESRLSVCDKIEESIEESLRQAEALRKSILKKAFEGKLVAQDPNDLPAPRPGVWFVYVLECEDGSYYKGFTKDILERWKQHAMGKGAEWTAKHPPRKLVHWEEFTSEHAAVQREKELKSGFGRKWLEREIKAGQTRQAGEPASILLVRIKAEREKNKKNK